MNESHSLDKDAPTHRNPGFPLIPAHPFHTLAAGGTGSGKSTSVLNLFVLHPKSPFDRTIWVAPRFSLEQHKLEKVAEKLGDRFVRVAHDDPEVPWEEEINRLIEEGDKEGVQQLLVLDDCWTKTGRSSFINDCFISGRHRNVSTCEIAQRVYHGAKTHRMNSDVMLLHTFGDMSEMQALAKQIAGNAKGAKQILEAYKAATQGKGPGGFLMIDQRARQHENPDNRLLRFRDSALDRIFPALPDA